MTVLNRAMEIVKAAGAGEREGLTFVLQLMAWNAVSRRIEVKNEFSFEPYADRPDTAQFAREAFKYYEHDQALGVNGAAFRFASERRMPLSDTDVLALMRYIHTPFPESDYSPEELLDVVTRTGSRRGDYQYFLPREVAELIVGLGELGGGDTVYCPFDSSLPIAVKAAEVTKAVRLEVKDESPIPYLLNLLLNLNIDIRQGDPIVDSPRFIENDELTKFDSVLSNPPIGRRFRKDDLVFFDPYERFPGSEMDLRSSDVIHLRHVLSQTRERAIVVVSDGLLFRTAPAEMHFKADLIKKSWLRAVIGLPSGVLTYSSMAVSILVFDKEYDVGAVQFIDAAADGFFEKRKGKEGAGLGKHRLVNPGKIVEIFKEGGDSEYSRLVPSEECAENDFNLVPQRYVLTGPARKLEMVAKGAKVRLDDICEIIRPQTLKDFIADDGEECFEVAVSDLPPDGLIKEPSKTFFVQSMSLKKLQNHLLLPDDVLLTVKGSTGKVGMVSPELNQKWFANQSFLVLRLRYNPHVESPVVLYRYLASPMGQALLQRLVGGATVPMISTKDIRNLAVVVPSREEQQEIIVEQQKIASLFDEIRRLESMVHQYADRHWALN